MTNNKGLRLKLDATFLIGNNINFKKTIMLI